jgi:hypothetical protein
VRAIVLLVLLAGPCLGEVPVIWNPPAGYGPTLRDIASRLPSNTPAREPDPITYGHEGSHFLSRFKPGEHGLYALEGRVEWIPIPPLRTAEVFSAVPEHERGTIYVTYLRQGQSEGWADRPTMILDEWTAYLRGSTIRRELKIASRQETDRHCMTFARYSRVLCRMARRCEGYDRRKLVDFCRRTLADCRQTITDWDTSIEFE